MCVKLHNMRVRMHQYSAFEDACGDGKQGVEISWQFYDEAVEVLRILRDEKLQEEEVCDVDVAGVIKEIAINTISSQSRKSHGEDFNCSGSCNGLTGATYHN